MVLRRARLLLLGLALVVGGAALAQFVQTRDGVTVEDVRFAGPPGQMLGARLYRPAAATAARRAPAILTVHADLARRAAQAGLAIELARRGYVVLALDQPGHGASDPPAANGSGGPEALRYLRARAFVDPDRIGLHGHGSGGGVVLAAAERAPDLYRAMVLDAAAPGAIGTPGFPRNLALIYGRYDGYSQALWGVARARDIGRSDRLAKLFGVQSEVVPGRIYGELAAGTGRVLFSPAITGATASISPAAIGLAVDWFDRTLRPGTIGNGGDQVWIGYAAGTLAALIGVIMVLPAVVGLALTVPPFRCLADPPDSALAARDGRWWLDAVLTAWLPVVTLFIFLGWGAVWLPAGAIFRQGVTNQIMVWMLLNAVISLGVGRMVGIGPAASRLLLLPSVGCATLCMAIWAAVAWATAWWFSIDLGGWLFALGPMTAGRFADFLVYLPGFTLAIGIILHRLNTGLSVHNDSAARHYASNIAALAGGLLLFVAIQYGTLLARGQLLSWTQPTNVILALELLPIMATVAVISTFIWRRTGNAALGSLVSAMLVTWFFAAGQAIQIN